MKASLFAIFRKYSSPRPKSGGGDLVLALSNRSKGTMKISDRPLENKRIRENRKRFLNELGIKLNQLVSAGLIHGNTVKVVTKKEKGKIVRNTDALLTAERGLFLSVTVADCLPIFIFDPEKKTVGIVHGGWRSLAQNILGITVKKLKDNFGCNPKNILVGVGPGISVCHFEIKNNILKYWEAGLPNSVFRKEGGKTFLDLKKVAKIQLINLGLSEKNIEINPDCTYCFSNKYFSYRKGNSKELKAMMAVIGIRYSD